MQDSAGDVRKLDAQDEDIGSNKTFSNILRVKADPPGISEDEKSKKLKCLAGAIAHGIRQYGEVQARCIGDAATAKGAKAVAVASGMVAVTGIDLYCRPTFMTVEMQDKDMTGICFVIKHQSVPKPQS